MGLRDWVSGLLGGAPAGDEDPSGAGPPADADDGGLRLSVDVDRRAAAIAGQYDLPEADARRLAEILADEVEREAGYAREMIADRVGRELDLDAERARAIVDTEVASIRNLARAERFERLGGDDVRVRWVDSAGRDDSPVCADVRGAIDERGPVTVDELRELLRDAAGAHPDGTPERADDLVPHERCRHTPVRHVE